MRLLRFCFSALATILLVYVLNRPLGAKVPMPLGKFLSPQTGFWQNAEDTGYDYNARLKLPQLKGKAEVYFDERLVPHVFAENDEDLCFIQGYLHAKFRLFQMDLQTKAAEGRASEIAGPVAINYDKEQRRLGMKYAAENTLRAVEEDPLALSMYSAYTAGVNAYINTLTESNLPLEYKLLNFKPEQWSNLRTCLLLKMMAKSLASGTEDDLNNTNLRSILTSEQFNALYPQVPDSLMPIIPRGSIFPDPAIDFKIPANADSDYFAAKPTTASEQYPADKDNGSNNWVIAGTKTAGGAPILCNDPHLELSLPSIWYEMQLTSPTVNTYGVSLPGSPFIIVGFNDSIAWGVTNAQRDVKDYYTIKFKDNSKKEYWFNNAWKPAQQRIEEIKVKGAASVFDTVAYTVFGPVAYDNAYPDTIGHQKALAIKWAAHDTGDDGFTFYKLNRANNYNDYVAAIKPFECPGQNFVFASKAGSIAIWQQGKFPARWEGQGLYVMPGEDSSYMWQGFIPQSDNPHALNPDKGFLQSANQRPADAGYPYFIPGNYLTPRGRVIEKFLGSMSGITVQQMMDLQNNYYNILAEDMVPILLNNIDETALLPSSKKYLELVKQWDKQADPFSKGQTVFQAWFDSLRKNIWVDELKKAGPATPIPDEEITMELLKKDPTALGFVNDKNTPAEETLKIQVTNALNKASQPLMQLENEDKLEWSKLKDVTIYHLLKQSLLPFARNALPLGGTGSVINAVKKSHGPSWRMIVQLANKTEAFGVYPGGQSGNPGSRFYDNAIDTWAHGKYYPLWMMNKNEVNNKRVKWVMKFENSE